MHIRLIQEADCPEVLAMVQAHHRESNYAAIAGPLDPACVAKGMAAAVYQPETNPCFVHEDDGVIAGMLHGMVYPNYFSGVPVFECLSFYIRPAYRSYSLMKSFINACSEWCAEQHIAYMEFGNATTMDTRIDAMFSRLKFQHVNRVYVRRV